ncbi:MAG: 4-hydroxy-tetrahydrodipicolinate reductase [Planctomycetota bacterium]
MTGTIGVHVHGWPGRMATACCAAIESAPDLRLVGRTGRGDDLAAALAAGDADVGVDFSVAGAAETAIESMLEAGLHVVSGTTGLPTEQRVALGALAATAGRGLLAVANFALGAVLLQRFAREAAALLPDVEIIELHHDRKRDAPSGTALEVARQLGEVRGPAASTGEPEAAASRGQRVHGVPIHSIRLPGLLAHHEVIFGGPGQTLVLRHDVLDRQAFMPGVLLGIRRIRSRRGLVLSLDTLLDSP